MNLDVYLKATVLLALILVVSSCKKEDPTGVDAPDIYIGQWFSPGCFTCCWLNLTINEASNGSYFLDANASQSNSCRGFKKEGEVLFDSTNMVLWVGKHKIEVKDVWQADSSWNTYSLDSGFWSMKANASGNDGGEIRTFYRQN